MSQLKKGGRAGGASNFPDHIPRPTVSRSSSSVSGFSSKTVTQAHLYMLNEGKHTDVTFVVGPSSEKIKCHQLFLKARSPVFEAMFSDDGKGSVNIISLPDIEPKTFRAFLEFLYADTFVATVSEALDLLHLAHQYDVQLLKDKCEELLKSEVKLEDAIAVFQAARKYNKPDLISKAGDMMAKSFIKLAAEKSFYKMDKDTLTYLLKRDDLKGKEVEIFKAAVSWGKMKVQSGESGSLKIALDAAIPLIRFPAMSLTEFTTAVVPTGLLPETTLVQIFTYFGAGDETTKKNISKTLKFSTTPRRRKGADAVVSLYSGPSSGRGYSLEAQILQECVGFQVAMGPKKTMWSSNGDCIPEVAISGLVIGSPVRDSQYGCSSSINRPTKLLLDISVKKAKRSNVRYDNDFEDLYSTNSVQLEWGEELVLALDPPVIVENSATYCITLKQRSSSSGYDYYKCRHPSPAYSHVPEASLESVNLKLTNVQRNHLESFWNSHGNITLLEKIHFLEQ